VSETWAPAPVATTSASEEYVPSEEYEPAAPAAYAPASAAPPADASVPYAADTGVMLAFTGNKAQSKASSRKSAGARARPMLFAAAVGVLGALICA
jgi:hypothetical protein